MVLAPMVDAIVMLLSMQFTVLGRQALSFFIFLLLTFVCSILLILFLPLFILLFGVDFLVTVLLFASCMLEIGSKDK